MEEASYFDQINMTKNWLEYDRKKFTPTNMNVGTWPKDYTDKHEQLNMTEIPMKMTEILNSLGRQTWMVEYDRINSFGHIHT